MDLSTSSGTGRHTRCDTLRPNQGPHSSEGRRWLASAILTLTRCEQVMKRLLFDFQNV